VIFAPCDFRRPGPAGALGFALRIFEKPVVYPHAERPLSAGGGCSRPDLPGLISPVPAWLSPDLKNTSDFCAEVGPPPNLPPPETSARLCPVCGGRWFGARLLSPF